MILDLNESVGMQQDAVVGVAMRHFDAAFKKIKPSVSEKVRLVYSILRANESNKIKCNLLQSVRNQT